MSSICNQSTHRLSAIKVRSNWVCMPFFGCEHITNPSIGFDTEPDRYPSCLDQIACLCQPLHRQDCHSCPQRELFSEIQLINHAFRRSDGHAIVDLFWYIRFRVLDKYVIPKPECSECLCPMIEVGSNATNSHFINTTANCCNFLDECRRWCSLIYPAGCKTYSAQGIELAIVFIKHTV